MALRSWAAPAVASAQGLDVSNYQGQFGWSAAVKGNPGLAFGVYRATQGLGGSGTNSPDPDAAWNHGQIAAHGLIRGAYHYLDPALDGALQAGYFMTEMSKLGITGTDMLWLDNETAKPQVTPAQTAACALAFMRELDTIAPRNPRGVYTFVNFALGGYCAGLEDYPLWLAYPALAAPAPPPPWTRWTFWQWGSRSGTDADAFNGTAANLAAWIASYAPADPAGPYRQVVPYQGESTLAGIAAKRGTTIAHLLQTTAGALTAAETEALGGMVLPAGTVFYTSSP